jgi:hypothetical protein
VIGSKFRTAPARRNGFRAQPGAQNIYFSQNPSGGFVAGGIVFVAA